MASGSSLQPHDRIARYLILGSLRSGGMGEVYRARDEALGRSVALKILPPELTRSDLSVRRFILEAQAASSLNHPNIVTIHEIGTSTVARSGDAPDRSPEAIHYIAMELIEGETLGAKIHEKQEDLGTLLGYLAQSAEGLAEAHASGIVHRDLKPSNIMVSRHGVAKVLDFGLAKLLEDERPVSATGQAETEPMTRSGAVLGTVGYMSPEQVQGTVVDARSDIFSFGCIIYEAVTRTRAFAGDSSIETMHQILHDQPRPVEELNDRVPADVRRLIRRCLAKKPEQRLQTAQDLALELREIGHGVKPVRRIRSFTRGWSRRRRRMALVAGVLLAVGIATAAVALRTLTKRDTAPPLRITAMAPRGVLSGLALSPDGRFLAYSLLSLDEGRRSLWVRQLATGSDVQILPPPLTLPPFAVTFSRDGNHLYYVMGDLKREGYQSLYEIPVLGGRPRKRVDDVDSRVSFSPKGDQICFIRFLDDQALLVLSDLDGGRVRVLARARAPMSFGSPTWSPDGGRIAVVESRSDLAMGDRLATYRVRDARREAVGAKEWGTKERTRTGFYPSLVWHPDGRSLVLSASDQPIQTSFQLWSVSFPKGQCHRITQDANSYFEPSISADGTTIAAVQRHDDANLWVAIPSTREVRQITFGAADDGGVRAFHPARDSIIVFEAVRNGSAQIYSVREDGTGERRLTPEETLASDPWLLPDGGVIHVRARADLQPHVWSMDTDGDHARPLTSGAGEEVESVSPDGNAILFRRKDAPGTLWGISVRDGQPFRIAESAPSELCFSSDGRRLLHELPARGSVSPMRQILPLAGGDPVQGPAFPPGSFGIRWAPDDKSFTYLNNSNLLRNLYRLWLDGGGPEEITQFKEGRIFRHDYSPDGKSLVLVRHLGNAVNLWLARADGSHPLPLTDFETGRAGPTKWTADGSRVFFLYGSFGDNAVSIRSFR